MTRFAIPGMLVASTPRTVSAEMAAAAGVIETRDLDGSGDVTPAKLTDRRGDVFAMFDQNDNGFPGVIEDALFDETRAADMENNAAGHGKGGHMQEGLTLGFNDTDADGAVSKAEFIANTGAWLVQVNHDGDGTITAADFGPQGN